MSRDNILGSLKLPTDILHLHASVHARVVGRKELGLPVGGLLLALLEFICCIAFGPAWLESKRASMCGSKAAGSRVSCVAKTELAADRRPSSVWAGRRAECDKDVGSTIERKNVASPRFSVPPAILIRFAVAFLDGPTARLKAAAPCTQPSLRSTNAVLAYVLWMRCASVLVLN